MQFYNKNNELINFSEIEDFMSFLVSNENTNLDIKKGIATIANLSASEEAKLLNTGDLNIVSAVINKLFKFGSIDAEGNIILDDDNSTINNIFGNIFDDSLTDTQLDELERYMTYYNYSIKRTDAEGNILDTFVVVDADGNEITNVEIAKINAEGEKIPVMVPNDISIQEWLSQDSKRDPSNYPSKVPNSLSALEWLASDSTRVEADYPSTVPNPQSLEIWLASDSNRDPENYPTEVYNTLTKEEWLAEDDTRVEEDYPEMIPNSETMTAWLAEDSKLNASDYEDEISNPQELVVWLADASNLDIANYPTTIDNPQILIDWLAEETNRTPNDYPTTTQKIVDGSFVWDTIELDYTIKNQLSLENITTLVAKKSNITKEEAKFEIEKSILDNADVQSEIVTRYVTSDNFDLKMKAMIHPKTDKTVMFNAVKTDATIPQEFKLGLINAINTKEQLISSLEIVSHFVNLDTTAGTTAEQAATSELKINTTKKIFKILLDGFATDENTSIDVETLVELIKA